MTNEKWLALVAAFGLALTVAACGDDEEGPTSCQSDEDCADDESCDTSCQLCASIDAMCATDAECTTEGETCQPIGEGCTAKACKAGEGPGPTTCTAQDECYPNQFCDEGITDVCTDISSVATCAAAHGQDSVPANGIMLWAQETGEFPGEGNCITHPDATVCPATSNWCAFTIFVYDPNNSLPQEHGALYNRVAYSTASGNWGPIGDVDVVDAERFVVYGCFSGTSLNGAVAIVNDLTSKTLQSNAICLSATAN